MSPRSTNLRPWIGLPLALLVALAPTREVPAPGAPAPLAAPTALPSPAPGSLAFGSVGLGSVAFGPTDLGSTGPTGPGGPTGPTGETGPTDHAPGPGAEPRIEHFLLELPGEDGPRAVGTLRWIGRRAGSEHELEWELDFPGEGVRLLAVERLGPGGARLTWRELLGSTSRSLVVEWGPAGQEMVLREWARDGTLRESRSLARGAVLPLYLLELARTGSLVQGDFLVLEPATRGIEDLSMGTSYLLAGEPGLEPTREVELRRCDGSLAGRYRFQGPELVSFEWQEGGIRGRRIGPGQYQELIEGAPGR
jgi:hypothetical protein